MSGALSPVQPKQEAGESPFEKKATFVTESDTTIDDEESEEDDLDKLDVIMKGERKE